MYNKFLEYREKYPDFIYKSYSYNIGDKLNIKYSFIIPGLVEFNPEINIAKEYIKIDYESDDDMYINSKSKKAINMFYKNIRKGEFIDYETKKIKFTKFYNYKDGFIY